MNHVYAFLEENGLATAEQVRLAQGGWTLKQSAALREALWAALVADKAEYREPAPDLTAGEFRFYASSSVRGDYGCSEWGCRIRKAANLARYAALYCESVIVPVRVNRHDGSADNFRLSALNLAGTISCLQEFRPAVETGILRLVPDELWFCEDCAARQSDQLSSISKAAYEFLLSNAGRFSVEYVPAGPEFPLCRAEVTGPDEYLEHGRIIRIYPKAPKWVHVSRGSNVRHALIGEELKESGIIEGLLSSLAGDATMQQFYGVSYGSKCLTDLAGQAQVLTALNSEKFMNDCTSGLLAGITHSVPLLDELPTATVVRIRNEEPDSFVRYRIALGKIVRDYVKTRKEVGPSDAREIYSDILLPEILRLRAKVRNQRKSKIGPALRKCTFSAVVVTLGLFGGLPPHIAAALNLAGSTGLLRDLHDAFSERERVPAEVRNENFYFLLRVLDEAE